MDTVILGCTYTSFAQCSNACSDALPRFSGRRPTRGRQTLRRRASERTDARGLVPLPHHRRSRSLPRHGPPLPPAADRHRRARRDRHARGGRMRHDGRKPDQLRELDVIADYLEQPHGSVLYAQGKTIVLCTATVEESVPRWLHRSGRGWMTAEYAMLPASTGERTQRAVCYGGPWTNGRDPRSSAARLSVCDFRRSRAHAWSTCDVLQPRRHACGPSPARDRRRRARRSGSQGAAGRSGGVRRDRRVRAVLDPTTSARAPRRTDVV